MNHIHDLTTSYLRKKTIRNHFELANFAIGIAKDHIRDDEGKSLNELLIELDHILEVGRNLAEEE